MAALSDVVPIEVFNPLTNDTKLAEPLFADASEVVPIEVILSVSCNNLLIKDIKVAAPVSVVAAESELVPID